MTHAHIEKSLRTFFDTINKRGERWNAAVGEVKAWLSSAPKIEPATGPRFHHATTALRRGDFPRYPDKTSKEVLEAHRGILDPFSVFVVEHDWVSAFKGTGDFDTVPQEVDFRLPY